MSISIRSIMEELHIPYRGQGNMKRAGHAIRKAGVPTYMKYSGEYGATVSCVADSEKGRAARALEQWNAQPVPPEAQARKSKSKRKSKSTCLPDVYKELERAYRTIDRLALELEDCKEQVRQLSQWKAPSALSERVRRALAVHGDKD